MFQPIVHCRDRSIFGYEALIRGPSDTPLHSPSILFDAAQRDGRLTELDLVCRQVAIKQFGALNLPGKLFLNVLPAVILSDDFQNGKTREYLLRAGLRPDQAVIELTEQQPIDDYELMREAVNHYRDQGFAVAVDDLGAGYSSLRHWAELRPDYVKIDRHFVQNIDDDATKRHFVRSIMELARGLGCRVVGEGVESMDEYRALWAMGLEFAQGYHIARPGDKPPRVFNDPDGGFVPERLCCQPLLGDGVGSLAQSVEPIVPPATVEQVVALFDRDPKLHSLAVVDDQRPIALVQRSELLGMYARRYSHELFAKRSILDFCRHNPLIVKSHLALEKVSRRITDAPDLSGDDDFIVVDEQGQYVGICSVMALLRKITELQVRNARYANPLTQLPGNVPINEYIQDLLKTDQEFAVAYCDLDHFKPFNDSYGYARGDDVIVALAKVLTECINPESDFVGHVGGDDFIVIFTSSDWEARCHEVLDRFSQAAPWFYDAADRTSGRFEATDRRGVITSYPLLSLSIGVVCASAGGFHSHYEVATLASEVKKEAKKIDGDSLFIDRRSHGCDAETMRVKSRR